MTIYFMLLFYFTGANTKGWADGAAKFTHPSSGCMYYSIFSGQYLNCSLDLNKIFFYRKLCAFCAPNDLVPLRLVNIIVLDVSSASP